MVHELTEKICKISDILNDPKQPLKDRFRALFTLRNIGGEEAIESIGKSFSDASALLKHELAYCLGQMQDKRALPILETVLRDLKQEPMVRHEAGRLYDFIRRNFIKLLADWSAQMTLEIKCYCDTRFDCTLDSCMFAITVT